MNLLEETIDVLKQNGKNPQDVLFVCNSGISFSWDKFSALANFEYNNGYGGNEIDLSLKVVGDDWWLERGEYDGAEWWEFKTMPQQPPFTDNPDISYIKKCR